MGPLINDETFFFNCSGKKRRREPSQGHILELKYKLSLLFFIHPKKCCFLNPNKDGIFEVNFFWGRGGGGVNLTPPFILQEELI